MCWHKCRSLEEIERMFVKPSEPREMRETQIVSRFCHYHSLGNQRRPLFVNCNVNVVKLCVTGPASAISRPLHPSSCEIFIFLLVTFGQNCWKRISLTEFFCCKNQGLEKWFTLWACLAIMLTFVSAIGEVSFWKFCPFWSVFNVHSLTFLPE